MNAARADDSVYLWGLEKNSRLSTIAEGLYLLGLAVRSAGGRAVIKYLPRDYIDGIKRSLPALHGGDPTGAFREFEPFYLSAFDPKYDKALVHGIQVYESDLDYIVPLVQFLRAHSKAPIVIGGPFPTLAPREALAASGADLLLQGECEKTLPALVRRLECMNAHRADPQCLFDGLKDIEGIGIAMPDGSVYLQGNPALPRTLPALTDSLEFWQGARRANFGDRAAGDASFLISTSRGCPRDCLFCSHANGRKHRRFAPEDLLRRLADVIDGIRSMIEKGDLATVYLNFNDDDLCLDREYALKIMDTLASRNLGERLRINVTSSIPALFHRKAVDEELIRRIARARVSVLNLGTDAFSDAEISQLKGGNYTLSMVRDLVHCLESHRLINNHFWLLSGPETTVFTIVEQLVNASALNRAYEYFVVAGCNYFIVPYFGSSIRNVYPPETNSDLYESREYLTAGIVVRDGRGRPSRVRFYGRILPRDTVACGLLRHLEANTTPDPSGFDFKQALQLSRDCISSTMGSGAKRRVCLEMLEQELSFYTTTAQTMIRDPKAR